jgi:hypothetical protein
LALAKTRIDVAVYLLQASPELFYPIYRILDPAGQFTHLRLEPVHAEFPVDCTGGTGKDGGAACAAVDLPLQHAEISFQSIETLLHRAILRSHRLGR